jgi:biotin-(acetyl-CoA carboxylase) ligase
MAPPKTALLLSVGFTPEHLDADHGWRLGAIVSLAMRDAAEDVAGLKDGTIWLKWPNDLVADAEDGSLRKVAGLLGETVTEGDQITSAVIGIGINSDWRASDFPWALAPSMTSLRELAGRRPINNDELLNAFLDRLEPRYEALAKGQFDAGGWSQAQRTTGRKISVEVAGRLIDGAGGGVDPETGELILTAANGKTYAVDSGEVVRCRVR